MNVLTKHETRRVLKLASIRDVGTLVKARVLVPAAYDPNGRPLFDSDDVRRAASARVTREARSVTCALCGRTWPRDPALEVPCPTCKAPIGSICKRPSGHRTYGGVPHPDRDRAAMAAGLLERCPDAKDEEA